MAAKSSTTKTEQVFISAVRPKLVKYIFNIVPITNRILSDHRQKQKQQDPLFEEAFTFLEDIKTQHVRIDTFANRAADLYIRAILDISTDITRSSKSIPFTDEECDIMNSLILRFTLLGDFKVEKDDRKDTYNKESIKISVIVKFVGKYNINFSRGLALLLAVRLGYVETTRILLDNGALVGCRGHLALITAFNIHEFDINSFNTTNWTIRDSQLINLLIEHGSDSNYYYWHVLGNDAQTMVTAFAESNIPTDSKCIKRAVLYKIISKERPLTILEFLLLSIIDHVTMHQSVPYMYELIYMLYEKICKTSPRLLHYEAAIENHYLQHWKIVCPEPYLSPHDREVD